MATSEVIPPPPYLPSGLRHKYLIHGQALTPNRGASADIDWEPNYEKYQKRVAARASLKGLPTQVPEGWPNTLRSPLAWTSDTHSESDYVYQLTTGHKEEIWSAVRHFKELGVHVRDINKANFPLPTLSADLDRLSDELHQGKGFFVLRGLSGTSVSDEDSSLAFLGLSSHVAPQFGRQDQQGSMIVHIVDANGENIPKEHRQSVYTNVAQPFHNDVFCEVLGLYTANTAAKGGNRIIASASTVYNELAATRPDIIHTLAKGDWTFDTFGRDPAYHQRPLMYHADGKLITNFSRRILTGAPPASPRTPGIPPMSEAQAEALDAVHFTAVKHQLSTRMEPGDVTFLNNHAVLHCRDAFEDDDDQRQRHLVRLWLRHPDKAWRVPAPLRMAWDRVYADVSDVDDEWPLRPRLDRCGISTRNNPSCGQG
ncbi:hypothetical protein PG985_012984 [Apiospora marii]|uniref:TauD/TfdA-like domain-containing protein n=1 Tax=Apiospora marii TaxID=335849 RepID=A0ABR1RC08_9PEZI